MSQQIYKISLILFSLLVFSLSFNVHAFEVINLPETPIKNDFVVTPARTEIVMKAGEKHTEYITVLNRLGVDYNFNVTVEDFSPSEDSGNPILTQSESLFSLKNYVKPDVSSFFLRQGSKARIGVTITLPKSISPGGKYTAVLISASPKQKVDSATTLVSRIGALLLIKVDGDVEEKGGLSNFVFKDGNFWISYRNEGNVHLNSYGVIEIRNEGGALLETIQVDPWIILPGSTRSRSLVLSGTLPDGKYTAKALINRGYEDIIDTKEISFRLGPIPVLSEVPEVGGGLSFGYYLVGLFILLGIGFLVIT